MSLLKATNSQLHVIFALFYTVLLITCKDFMKYCGLITLKSYSLMLFENRESTWQGVLSLAEMFVTF